jgi:hypothetical protein
MTPPSTDHASMSPGDPDSPFVRSGRGLRAGVVVGIAAVVGLVVFGLNAPEVYSVSPVGPTGKTLKSGGAGCAACHGASADSAMTTAISGPGTLYPGQAGTYTITVTKSTAGNGTPSGIDVAASDATALSVVNGMPTVLSNGEIVHSSNVGSLRTTSGGSANYQFRFTMPASAVLSSPHTLYGVAEIGYPGGWAHDLDNFVVTTGPPPAPSSLTATTPTTNSLSLSWTGTSPEFRVLYKTGSSPTSPTDGTLVYEGPGTSATASSLTPGTAYFFAAYGKAGSTYSSTAATTGANTSPIPTGGSLQVTANAVNETWSDRASATSRGKLLWTNGADVLFFDGAAVSTVQSGTGLTGVADFVFTLGTGAATGDVIGAWRRDTDFAWVWTRLANGSTTLVDVKYTNPIMPGQPMNPEGVAVADGCVFMILQAFSGGNAIKHVYSIDPATGQSTNLTGTALVPGVARLSTSGCKATWILNDGTGTPKLHYYNGSAVAQIDSGSLSSAQISQGRIVYSKTVSGISQVFLYDTTVPSPAPVALSSDISGSNSFPRTDGRHVAWIHIDADNVTRNVVLNGGLVLTSDSSTRPVAPSADNSLQVQRGQLLFADSSGTLRYYRSGGLAPVDISPATTFTRAWLADGYVAWLGTSSDGGVDPEVFRYTGVPPADSVPPAPPLAVVATPGPGEVTVRWDRVVGASSYNLYVAEEPGVTKANYASLRGGERIDGVTSPYTVSGVSGNRTFSFVVTTVESGTEGPISAEARATHVDGVAWSPGSGAPATSFYSVAADPANASVAYAAGGNNVYKTANGGASWTALGGLVAGKDVRAVAAHGGNVYAVTRIGDIYRSADAGANWTLALDTPDLGEQVKSVAVDPESPGTIYAGSLNLTGSFEPVLVKSVDNGQNWVQLSSGSIRAYSLALGPSGLVLAGGTGTPNVGRSTNGGLSWTSVQPAGGFVYAVAVDRVRPWIAFAGLNNSSQISQGIYKTTNAGAAWTARNTGLPTPLSQVNCLLVDPVDPNYVHACVGSNYVYSVDGGLSWTAADIGLTAAPASLAMTGSRQLLAATADGLFRTDLSPPASISIDDAIVAEGNAGTTNANFAVSLSGPSAGVVTVSYSTADGTALAGSDYTAASAVLTFAPGEISKTIAVPVLGDSVVEGNESFTVSLFSPSSNATIADGSGAGTILNDDATPPAGPPPFVTISDFSVVEGNAGQSIAYLSVSLSAPSAQTVTVNYSTADGTAIAGSDYVARSSTLSFRPGQTVETAILTIVTDTISESSEFFVVNLTSASGATVTDAQGAATIIDDDPSGGAVAVPQYRLFNDVTHEHLYTTDLNEYNVLGANGWLKEGQAYQMFTSTGSYGGTFVVPLFRLFHPQSQQHLWSTDANEATVLGETPDWIYEGITGYVLPTQVGGTTALYRLFLASPPVHLWTTDQNEYDFLGANGWIKEGAIGYVIP